jgi:hypothetical protein
MDYDQQTIELFITTRDGLRPASIAALIDLAEGNPFSIFAAPFIYGALKERGLAEIVWDERGLQLSGGHVELTEYGRRFVAWLRIPRDFPAQMGLFEDE